jgi:predicted AlkP superfamily pyrophosphatase or phosphodiesterase
MVLNVVGLTPDLMRFAPRLSALAREGFQAALCPPLPAVTCSAQASLLTGSRPQDTGIVGNGWYFRDLSEVLFWRQSNRLVSGEMVWDAMRAREPKARCAKMFWWYNMYSSADWSVTPRPAYPADGRKIPDIYSEPPYLRRELNEALGRFPLFNFWGPTADILSSRWIADASLHLLQREKPELMLVYLPHLDYNLQRLGPEHERIAVDVAEVDAEAGKLIDAARALGYEIVVLSEYGITAVSRPVHLNRVLRESGYLRVQEILDSWELLDCGACKAFAVADHQLAHITVKDPKDVDSVAKLIAAQPGVAAVATGAKRAEWGLDHERSGEVIALAERDAWFTYYYWLDDRRAPDFARTVDIHRKPGYDPVELFLDPAKPLIKGRIAWRLIQKILGFRYLMDVIPLDASLVKGSHGRLPDKDSEGPLLIASSPEGAVDRMDAWDVKSFLLRRLFSK